MGGFLHPLHLCEWGNLLSFFPNQPAGWSKQTDLCIYSLRPYTIIEIFFLFVYILFHNKKDDSAKSIISSQLVKSHQFLHHSQAMIKWSTNSILKESGCYAPLRRRSACLLLLTSLFEVMLLLSCVVQSRISSCRQRLQAKTVLWAADT